MNLQDLLAYLQRSNTDVLGYLPSMLNNKISPTPVPNSDNADYDAIGWQLENGRPKLGPVKDHYTDKYKLPNHPTFSDESQYSNQMFHGGHWYQNGMAYDPSKLNEKTNGLLGIVEYLKNSDPNTQLLELPVNSDASLALHEFARDYKNSHSPGFHSVIANMGTIYGPMFDRTPKLSTSLEDLFKNEKYIDVTKLKPKIQNINFKQKEGAIKTPLSCRII